MLGVGAVGATSLKAYYSNYGSLFVKVISCHASVAAAPEPLTSLRTRHFVAAAMEVPV